MKFNDYNLYNKYIKFTIKFIKNLFYKKLIMMKYIFYLLHGQLISPINICMGRIAMSHTIEFQKNIIENQNRSSFHPRES